MNPFPKSRALRNHHRQNAQRAVGKRFGIWQLIKFVDPCHAEDSPQSLMKPISSVSCDTIDLGVSHQKKCTAEVPKR